MLNVLPDRPDAEKLAHFLQRLLEEKGEEIEFVVLFGSTARGNWSAGSDYDVLIGLRGDNYPRFIDRLLDFTPHEGNIEVFPYTKSEWTHMFQTRHPLLLEALEYGIVLFDRGRFADMHATFRRWRREGRVVPWQHGWRIE